METMDQSISNIIGKLFGQNMNLNDSSSNGEQNSMFKKLNENKNDQN
jgi:hypothetical protein